MKALTTLGKRLSRREMKSIYGGKTSNGAACVGTCFIPPDGSVENASRCPHSCVCLDVLCRPAH